MRQTTVDGVLVTALAQNARTASRLLDIAADALEDIGRLGLAYPFLSLTVAQAKTARADGAVGSALIAVDADARRPTRFFAGDAPVRPADFRRSGGKRSVERAVAERNAGLPASSCWPTAGGRARRPRKAVLRRNRNRDPADEAGGRDRRRIDGALRRRRRDDAGAARRGRGGADGDRAGRRSGGVPQRAATLCRAKRGRVRHARSVRGGARRGDQTGAIGAAIWRICSRPDARAGASRSSSAAQSAPRMGSRFARCARSRRAPAPRRAGR